MKVKRADSSQERMVLIGMITNRAVLGAIAARWVEGMFSSRWGNLIGSWCVDYYKRYKKPPGKQITALFDQWSQEAKRETETVELIERFLSSLSREYKTHKESVNPDYVIDIATSYFTRVAIKSLTERLEACLEDGELDEADTLIKKFGKVQIGSDVGIDVLSDDEVIRTAMEAKRDPLIVYPHGLGEFYGNALERDGFIAFQGTEKRGKTWILMDIAWNAMLQGRKVVFFEVGDLSRNQIMRRFLVRAAKHPLEPRRVEYPLSITFDESDNSAVVEYEQRVFNKPLDLEQAQKACRKILTKTGGDSLLKLFVYPNSSVSVYNIRSVLETLERNDFVPDVVVIDYADILAPPSGVVDSREQINTTWKQLRSISQSFHCLVVTATQAKAAAYAVETMSMQHFSEDKRKNAHVTGMIGLNATDDEKRRGILRLNWLNLREQEYSETICCHVAQCLPIGNPCVHSVFAVP